MPMIPEQLQIDGDQCDELFRLMDGRIQVLFHVAEAAQTRDYPHDVSDALAIGVEALWNDWADFRRNFVTAVRRAARHGQIAIPAKTEAAR